MTMVTRIGPALALAALLVPASASAAEPGFTITVALSPEAAAKLASLKESVTVAAYYDGEPLRAYRKRAIEGVIDLGQEHVTIPGQNGTAQLTMRPIKRDRLAWVLGGAPNVLINVYSARRSSPDNLLDCEIYQGPVAPLQNAGKTLACKLLGER